jgi:hypothetical protein
MAFENDFFLRLSERFRVEPKFSDIIWVICSSNEHFQNIFLQYCFDTNVSVSGDMVREYEREDSIPDFYFQDINNDEYIIENKINDHGDHFEQYKNTFPNSKRAFIANYYEPDHDGWKVKTWKDFISVLENRKDEFPEKEIDFFNGFICYLKSINNISEAKTMDLSNIASLDSFYITLNQIVSECRLVKLNDYNIPTAFNRYYYGKYFSYENGKNKNVYIWLGLYLYGESGIYIKFQSYQNDGWLPKKERNIIENLKEGVYFDTIEIDEGNLYIHLKDEYFEKLCSKIDINEQKDILKSFLEEIISLIL